MSSEKRHRNKNRADISDEKCDNLKRPDVSYPDILIIDDEPMNFEVLSFLLSARDLKCETYVRALKVV